MPIMRGKTRCAMTGYSSQPAQAGFARVAASSLARHTAAEAAPTSAKPTFVGYRVRPVSLANAHYARQNPLCNDRLFLFSLRRQALHVLPRVHSPGARRLKPHQRPRSRPSSAEPYVEGPCTCHGYAGKIVLCCMAARSTRSATGLYGMPGTVDGVKVQSSFNTSSGTVRSCVKKYWLGKRSPG